MNTHMRFGDQYDRVMNDVKPLAAATAPAPTMRTMTVIALIPTVVLGHYLVNAALVGQDIGSGSTCDYSALRFVVPLGLYFVGLLVDGALNLSTFVLATCHFLSILLGAYALMGSKPHTWYLSMEWDCLSPVNERGAMFGYTTIVTSTVVFLPLLRKWYHGYTRESGWGVYVAYLVAGGALFGLCYLLSLS
jgi:hypothetical protein